MSKKKIVLLSVLLVILLTAGGGLFYFRHYFIGTSYAPISAKTNADFGIADAISSMDRDEDGIDDQTDILQEVRAYIATQPKYQSRYYATGYPDDGYGVCTDVVAFGLLNAGYDLRQLVNADIRSHPQDYNIDTPDQNIDFRRVRNLKVYFARTDIYDIDQWQGGDIVIFESHIGVVSDHRNDRGVTYVIHHATPWQESYEQDILEHRDDIVGHYRISE